MNTNSLARRAVKAAALPLGLPNAVRSDALAILLYHRVGVGTREIDVDLPLFRWQMAHLRQQGIVHSLDDLMGDEVGGVVVTIDDGYHDFYEHALPVIVEYQIPVVLYLATGLVANGQAATDHREQLTWPELREAVSTGLVTVGGHTHDHVDLSRATERQSEEELRRCQELVEDQLGVPCRHFAFPWAVSGPAADRVARRMFDTAASRWGTNHRATLDRHRLGRTPVLRSDGHAFFRAKARGLLDGEALAYRVLRRGPWRKT